MISVLSKSQQLAALVLLLCFSTCVIADDAKTAPVSREYCAAIAQIQKDLDAGKNAEALDRLQKTGEAMRSFEYEYLTVRANGEKNKEGKVSDLIHTLARPEAESRYGVLNELNRDLVYICRDGSLVIQNLAKPDEKPKRIAESAATPIWSGAFSRDCKTFFTGHQDGTVLVWDVATWKIRHKISLESDLPVGDIAAAPDGSAFVAESKKQLELWSLAEGEPKKVADVDDRFNFGEGLAFSPKGDMLATGGMFDIIVHDAQTGAELRTMKHASYTMGLEFSPDGKRIASAPRGNVNRFLAVFDTANAGPPLFNAGPFGNYIAGMAFTPDGKRIAATGCENVVRLFDATNGSIVLELKRTECSAKPAFTRDGKLLGWSEPGGYRYVDLEPTAQDPK